MLPFKSLDAVSSASNGASKDLEVTLLSHTMLLTFTGFPTGWRVFLEGSHNGSDWFIIQTVTDVSLGTANAAVRFVRARLDYLTGGTSPTVTATIGSA